jgi:hypothetical protein
MKGCVGAIDGIIIKTRRPSHKEDSQPRRFFCSRKQCYGLNAQATCDAIRKFTDVDISFPSSTGDSLAHRSSDLGMKLEQGLLPDWAWLNGDSAYCNSKYMMTPVSGTAANMGIWADSYNYQQSSIRMPIECAFGMLVRRWGVLWRPLECRMDRWASIVTCCMRLHNICIDYHVVLSEGLPGDGCIQVNKKLVDTRPRLDRDGNPVGIFTDDQHRPVPEGTSRRDDIIASIKAQGLVRPN